MLFIINISLFKILKLIATLHLIRGAFCYNLELEVYFGTTCVVSVVRGLEPLNRGLGASLNSAAGSLRNLLVKLVSLRPHFCW